MTRTEHLLTILAEECAEVAQCASKALRFGLDDGEPGQSLNNAVRLRIECDHVFAAIRMIEDEELLVCSSEVRISDKVRNVERFLVYSQERGTLESRP